MKIALSNISGTGFGGLPTFGNREINTTIRLKDGETNMLAGLIRDEERTTLAGIPGLSDLPLIGHLFASNHKETQQTDIVLTLTPHIVRVLDLTEEDLRPFRMGRDSVTRGRRAAGAQIPRDEPINLPMVRDPTTSRRQRRRPTPAFPQPLQPTANVPEAAGWRGSAASASIFLRPARRAICSRSTQRAVSALDGLERRQLARALGRQRRRDERHSRTDIAAVEAAAAQRRRTADDDAVRIAEEQIRLHRAELLEREQAQLVHPVVDQRPPIGLGRQHGDEADHVARESRPESGRDASRGGQRPVLDDEAVVFGHAVQTHLAAAAPRRLPCRCRARAGDFDVTAGYRRDYAPAPGFDVVAVERMAWRREAAPVHSTRIVVVPSPSIDAPIARRKRHSSTTCGSIAACRISVARARRRPRAAAVSVPVTDASSR